MSRFTEYAAIDPLALIFPTSVYVVLAEKLHPHVPKVAEIQEAVKNLTQEERAFVRAKARVLADYAKAVTEAVG